MKNAYIGIDGGGTQTRFLAVDDEGNKVAQIIIDKGSKPNHYGVGTTVRVLESGLDQLQTELKESDYSITAIYAGISGCATFTSMYQPIIDSLSDYCDTTKLGGDIKTNFRAGSEVQSGVALLAGTGSAIANIYPDGNWVALSSLCHGAKDIIFELAMRYQDGQLKGDLSSDLEKIVGKSLLMMNEQQILKNQINTDVLTELNQETLSKVGWSEYSALIRRIGDRWAYKATGRIYSQQQRGGERTIEVIISGGMWAFEYLRSHVVGKLESTFGGEIVIRYRPERRAVDGAATLAREL